MLEISAAQADSLQSIAPASQRPVVLITEQQLAFSTAAAMPLPRTSPTRGLLAAFRAMFLTSSREPRPAPRQYYSPRRDKFLEDAAMAREMHRL